MSSMNSFLSRKAFCIYLPEKGEAIFQFPFLLTNKKDGHICNFLEALLTSWRYGICDHYRHILGTQ